MSAVSNNRLSIKGLWSAISTATKTNPKPVKRMDRVRKLLLVPVEILIKILSLCPIFSILRSRSHLPRKPTYPFDLLLAPLPNKYVGSSYAYFPAKNTTPKDYSLFLYPGGWCKQYICLFALWPSLPLFTLSNGLGGLYLCLYFCIYRFVYLYMREPVLNILLLQWPPFLNRFIREVPQQEYSGSVIRKLMGPRELRKWYRQSVNWSSKSQQECFLVLAIFDLLKEDETKTSMMARANIKFLLFAFFPVWCSYLLLLLFLLLHFTCLYNKFGFNTALTLNFFVAAGTVWAVLALFYGIKMKWFLERFSKNHERNNLRAWMRRWLPVCIKEDKLFLETLDFKPSVFLVSNKMITLVQLAVITIFFLLIRIAQSLHPSSGTDLGHHLLGIFFHYQNVFVQHIQQIFT